MIIGIGEDTCDIRRLAEVLARHPARFLERCFTPAEREKSARRKGRNEPASTLAKRFAAKEACAKALGTGLGREGVSFRAIGVVNAATGAPTLELTGAAAMRMRKMTPSGMTPRIHVTLGDEYPYARALVIIEAIPASDPLDA
ncbi:MAG: holo-ACP synthase [Rhodospirillales bacterium]|nr:holo-ACP synthase [Alphaproteobacteria bacterium]MCB9986857.1 holo-ACP synthase [Rhodospirillales bacterium]USO08382.1 MAG: holo-ACP synthase [Rhodospirillales bacterium]